MENDAHESISSHRKGVLRGCPGGGGAAGCMAARAELRREGSPHSSDSVRPTAAFLDLSHTALGGLVERRVLQNPDADWLERAEIETVLRERELQAPMSPEACGERAAIGRLLQADMLILLRHVEEPKAQVQLVVCETQQGLRLAIHALAVTGDVERDADRLSALAGSSIRERPREIREICAVPPFLSDDLTYEHDHLKTAYARLVEQTLRREPGLLTVELEEAHSIAREVQLTGHEVQRRMPLYFHGRFRSRTAGSRQMINLQLSVARGERALATRDASDLPVNDGAKFVHESAIALIEQTVGLESMPPDPKQEAKQLAERAEVSYQLGAHDEAAPLAEASLLLDGTGTRMRIVAALSWAALASRDTYYVRGVETVARGIRTYLRALEHYESIVRDLPSVDQAPYLAVHTQLLWVTVKWSELFHAPGSPNEVRRVAADLRQRELEILLRIVRTRLAARTYDVRHFMAYALAERSPQEQIEILFPLLTALPPEPSSERLARDLLTHGRTAAILDHPPGRDCLKRLTASQNPYVRRAAEELLRQVERGPDNSAAASNAALGPPPPDPQIVRFEPVKLTYHDEKLDKAMAPAYVGGCIPAGPGTDLLWENGERIFVMKQPGTLKLIWDGKYKNGMGVRFPSVRYDGRFVWVAVEHPCYQPSILVIDPQQEKIWTLNEQQGLPIAAQETIHRRNLRHRLWVEPIAPGKALFVSYFGRMAIGTVVFDPAQGTQVDVFFEARVQYDAANPELWRDPHYAFEPTYMFAFHSPSADNPDRRQVVIGGHRPIADRPLVVDPDTHGVKVLSAGFEHERNLAEPLVLPTAMYHLVFGDGRFDLVRERPPLFRPETLMTHLPEGRCVSYNGKMFVVGSYWWQVDPYTDAADRVRVLSTRLPWTHRNTTVSQRHIGNVGPVPEANGYRLEMLCPSPHYGLLAVRREEKLPNYHDFLRVVFQEPQTPLPPLATSR